MENENTPSGLLENKFPTLAYKIVLFLDFQSKTVKNG